MTAEQLIRILRHEIRFTGRQVNNLQTADFDAVDEISMSLQAMRDALDSFELEQRPACEEIPEGVKLPEAA